MRRLTVSAVLASCVLVISGCNWRQDLADLEAEALADAAEAAKQAAEKQAAAAAAKGHGTGTGTSDGATALVAKAAVPEKRADAVDDPSVVSEAPDAPDPELPGETAPDPGSDPPVEEPAPDPYAESGPPPASSCAVTKDTYGFFTRVTSASPYAAYVPPSYDGSSPVRLVVGIHGCGDSAMNFATWAIAPWESRATQDHIAISIGGKDGQCWSMATDGDKVLAAIDDIASCFWVHKKKVVVAGYSSGGMLAYRLGLQHADRFAGILVESSGLYGAGGGGLTPDTLLANAAWKINIAHLTHQSDTTFPLSKVKADWTKTLAAGFPLVSKITAGTHEGTSADWSGWLLPQASAFVAP